MKKTITSFFNNSLPFIFRLCLPLFATIFLTSSLFSQHESKLQFDHLSVEQGLSNVVVNCIFQDRQGYIWIGTGVGLNLYDGNSFKIYNIYLNDRALYTTWHRSCILDRSTSLLLW